jgi:hypothetical protein
MPSPATKMRRHRPHLHAKKSPVVARGAVDPRVEELQASAVALSLDLATSQRKHLAVAGGVTVSRASRWATEGRGNPLFDLTQMIVSLTAANQHPGALIAHAHMAMEAALMSVSDADLVRRFWEAMGREAEKEGAENRVSQTFARTGDLEALRRAMLDEAALQTEIAALCLEMERREIDPRSFDC